MRESWYKNGIFEDRKDRLVMWESRNKSQSISTYIERDMKPQKLNHTHARTIRKGRKDSLNKKNIRQLMANKKKRCKTPKIRWKQMWRILDGVVRFITLNAGELGHVSSKEEVPSCFSFRKLSLLFQSSSLTQDFL